MGSSKRVGFFFFYFFYFISTKILHSNGNAVISPIPAYNKAGYLKHWLDSYGIIMCRAKLSYEVKDYLHVSLYHLESSQNSEYHDSDCFHSFIFRIDIFH